jgi:hypothetical protein
MYSVLIRLVLLKQANYILYRSSEEADAFSFIEQQDYRNERGKHHQFSFSVAKELSYKLRNAKIVVFSIGYLVIGSVSKAGYTRH